MPFYCLVWLAGWPQTQMQSPALRTICFSLSLSFLLYVCMHFFLISTLSLSVSLSHSPLDLQISTDPNAVPCSENHLLLPVSLFFALCVYAFLSHFYSLSLCLSLSFSPRSADLHRPKCSPLL